MLWLESCCRKKTATPVAPLFNSLHWHWLPTCSFQNKLFKKMPQSHTSHYIHNPPATLLPSSSMLHLYMPTRNLRTYIQLIASFFPPSKTNFGLYAFNLPHQTSGTNYQLTSNQHLTYHLSKPTLKLIVFNTHLDWSRDRAPQIRLRRFGLCALYKWLLSYQNNKYRLNLPAEFHQSAKAMQPSPHRPRLIHSVTVTTEILM